MYKSKVTPKAVVTLAEEPNEISYEFRADETAENVRGRPYFAREGAAIQGEIQRAISDLMPSDFHEWVRQEYGEISNPIRQVGRSIISAYIEHKLNIRFGVFFTDNNTLQIGWVRGSFMSLTPATWMTEVLEMLPAPKWNLPRKAPRTR